MGYRSKILTAFRYSGKEKNLHMKILKICWRTEQDYLNKSNNFMIYSHNLSKTGYTFLLYRKKTRIPKKFRQFAKKVNFKTMIGNKIFFVVQCKYRVCPAIKGSPSKAIDNNEWIPLLKSCGMYQDEFILDYNELVLFT